MTDTGEVTRLLVAARAGDRESMDRVMPLVYEELRRLARRQLSHERPGHTFDSGALVHEAYLKLTRLERVQWQDRVHFFSIASRLMRRILIDRAEHRDAAKRGGGDTPVTLDDLTVAADDRHERFVALDEALTRLEALNPRQCRVVECRFFGGLSLDETATALDVSPATVKRDWTMARAWLNRELT
ncbi:MAG TPA: sigma-70 family RNA polymerase sigma factor [Gemmatimonadaceae bacterium]|nr:sigma-70 family RNA polymerase sigma factor [Gemmatimonadaceae bacterium]